jgi:thiosulfate/3-mercaptopyruvate sulfurtransferase
MSDHTLRPLPRLLRPSLLLAAFVLLLFGPSSSAPRGAAAATSDDSPDPWTAAQTVQPADLMKEIGNPKSANHVIVACVGFRPLFSGAHVPGAVFHGAASTEPGLADLKRWAQSLPHSANVVLYCGCCPLVHCPNLRPAFIALRDMGFTHLRVLILPTDFATDWIGKGFPVEKGGDRGAAAR